jgi:hypothetical protein
MKKLLPILLAVSLAVSVGAGAVFADSTTQGIEFDLDEGIYEEWDLGPGGGDRNVTASAVLDGNIRFAKEYCYLSAMTGTVTIDGVVHQILVRTPKPSETIYYYEWQIGFCPVDCEYGEEMYCYVEVNIQGNMYIGTLLCSHYIHYFRGQVISEGSNAQLLFQGINDGKWVICSLSGDWPEIG